VEGIEVADELDASELADEVVRRLKAEARNKRP
jgi:hypothetical protein